MNADECIRLLTQRAAELDRLPRKDDFESGEVLAVKTALGPWPRALEVAGLKPVTQQRLQKLEARRRKKRRQ